MRIGIQLVRSGDITAEQLFAAVEMQAERRPPIGQLAIRSGKMTVGQVFEVLAAQDESGGQFGAVAKRLRFLTKRNIADLLMMQIDETPSISDCLLASGVVSPLLLEDAAARLRAAQDTTRPANQRQTLNCGPGRHPRVATTNSL